MDTGGGYTGKRPVESLTRGQKAAHTRKENKKRKAPDESEAKKPDNDSQPVVMTEQDIENIKAIARQQGAEEAERKQYEEDVQTTTCGICQGVMVCAVTFQGCGHPFCQPCIENMRPNENDDLECPFCKHQVWYTHGSMEQFAKRLQPHIHINNIAKTKVMPYNTNPEDQIRVYGASMSALTSAERVKLCDALSAESSNVDCSNKLVDAIHCEKRVHDALAVLRSSLSDYVKVLDNAMKALANRDEDDGMLTAFTKRRMWRYFAMQNEWNGRAIEEVNGVQLNSYTEE